MERRIGEDIRRITNFICSLAVIGCVILAIVQFVAAGEVHGNAEERALIISGFLWLIAGPVACWMCYLIMSAFGQMVDDIRENKEISARIYMHLVQQDNAPGGMVPPEFMPPMPPERAAEERPAEPAEEQRKERPEPDRRTIEEKLTEKARDRMNGDTWYCPKCGTLNAGNRFGCQNCGEYR